MIPPRPAQGRPRPLVLEGAYVRLEPLNASRVPALYAAVTAPGVEERFRFMSEPVLGSEDEFGAWVREAATGGSSGSVTP